MHVGVELRAPQDQQVIASSRLTRLPLSRLLPGLSGARLRVGLADGAGGWVRAGRV